MRILVISCAFPPMRSGEADHAFHLCQNLANAGLEVHVLTPQDNVAASGFTMKVNPIMRNWSWLDLPRLIQFLKRCSPDAVLLMYIGSGYNDHPMITFAPTVSKRLLPQVPFVTQFEYPSGSLAPYRCWILTRLLRKVVKLWAGEKDVSYIFGTLLRDSDRIIVLSDSHRARLSEYFPGVNSKSDLVPPAPIMLMSRENGGTTRRYGREALDVNPKDFLITYFGRIYPSKGVETLLKAFQIVSRKRGDVRLMVLGGIVDKEFPKSPFYAQEVRGMPEELGIDDKVIWIGEYAWDSDEASMYLRAADACVLPFDFGVFMNNTSFAAAAAHGLPIITTQGAIVEQPFVHGENVFLCPPKNPEAMAAAIETVMDSPGLQQRLRVGARELTQEWFSWNRVVERTIEALRTVVA